MSRRLQRRDRLALLPLPGGFPVTAVSQASYPGTKWKVVDPAGKAWFSSGCFYDDHDQDGERAEDAAVAWGRVAVQTRTYRGP